MCISLLHLSAQILTPYIFVARMANVEIWAWSKSLYKVLGHLKALNKALQQKGTLYSFSTLC